MVAKHMIVLGLVQGVGFRNYTQRVAQEEGIIGWARNLSSGEVEILALADTIDDMQRFIQKVRQGPSRSQVSGLQIFDVDSKHIQGHTFLVISDGESKSEFKS